MPTLKFQRRRIPTPSRRIPTLCDVGRRIPTRGRRIPTEVAEYPRRSPKDHKFGDTYTYYYLLLLFLILLSSNYYMDSKHTIIIFYCIIMVVLWSKIYFNFKKSGKKDTRGSRRCIFVKLYSFYSKWNF